MRGWRLQKAGSGRPLRPGDLRAQPGVFGGTKIKQEIWNPVTCVLSRECFGGAEF